MSKPKVIIGALLACAAIVTLMIVVPHNGESAPSKRDSSALTRSTGVGDSRTMQVSAGGSRLPTPTRAIGPTGAPSSIPRLSSENRRPNEPDFMYERRLAFSQAYEEFLDTSGISAEKARELTQHLADMQQEDMAIWTRDRSEGVIPGEARSLIDEHSRKLKAGIRAILSESEARMFFDLIPRVLPGLFTRPFEVPAAQNVLPDKMDMGMPATPTIPE